MSSWCVIARSLAARRRGRNRNRTRGEPSAPASLSDFAAGWLFSEGEPEGVPFADGATVPESLQGPPSFLGKIGQKVIDASPEGGVLVVFELGN